MFKIEINTILFLTVVAVGATVQIITGFTVVLIAMAVALPLLTYLSERYYNLL